MEYLRLRGAAAHVVLVARLPQSRAPRLQADLSACGSEWQIVLCADVPVNDTAALSACCGANRPLPQVAAAIVATAGAQQQGAAREVLRPDLDAESGPYSQRLDWRFGDCTPQLAAEVPAFSTDGSGKTIAWVVAQAVPKLSPERIRHIKRHALDRSSRSMRTKIDTLRARAANATAGSGSKAGLRGAAPFKHPGGYAGADELGAMQWLLERGGALQAAARGSLLTGRWVPRSVKGRSGWYPPTGTPSNYSGPYAMRALRSAIGGVDAPPASCPANYPAGAPPEQCGHTAFVELDAAMAHKSALAYAATGDERYARQAARILAAWASNNREFGVRTANGPLEAAWGCAALARAAEVLRATWRGFRRADVDTFVAWANAQLMPNVDYFVDVLSAYPPGTDARKLLLGNWHASCADCMVALGVLSDDRARYRRGLALLADTVASYYKWGRGDLAEGHLVGESTETFRDIYHSLFGLGSLIQAAETAWGQDEDAYAAGGHALAAALELHARAVNAWDARDERMLPGRWRLFGSMPPPPRGCAWRWVGSTQRWASFSAATGAKCSDMADGDHYVLGAKYLPTGFEVGYNHFAGRLGMRLPETAALLARYPVDWQEFSWGPATLTHAGSAALLWRSGVARRTLCKPGQGRPNPQEETPQEQTPAPGPPQQQQPQPQPQPQEEKRPGAVAPPKALPAAGPGIHMSFTTPSVKLTVPTPLAAFELPLPQFKIDFGLSGR